MVDKIEIETKDIVVDDEEILKTIYNNEKGLDDYINNIIKQKLNKKNQRG